MDLLGIISLPNWFIFSSIIVLLVYLHYIWNFTYWKKQGIPGPTPWPLIGNLDVLNFKFNSCDQDLKDYQNYGPVYGSYMLTRKILAINDPELMKRVLIKDFDVFRNRETLGIDDVLSKGIFFTNDEEWKINRKVLSPMFSAAKLKRMSPLMKQCSENLFENLKEFHEKNESFDCLDVFRRYTSDVFGKCIFGVDVDVNDPNNKLIKYSSQLTESGSVVKIFFMIMFPRIAKMLGMKFLPDHIAKYFLKVTETVFETRKKSKEDRGDFVQIALELMAQNENVGAHEDVKNALNYESICANSISLLIAGIDTTRLTLSYLAYCLALNPDVQDKLIDEVDEAVEKFGDIDYDALHEMPYLSAVIDETLRLYPPATKAARVCARDYDLDGAMIPKGSLVFVCEYAMQRNPEFWKDPEIFDPSRFLDPNNQVNPFHYFPFLQGPRNCIAKRFALLEIKLGIAMLLRKMRFKTCSKTQIPLKWKRKDNMLAESVDLTLELR